MKYILLFLLQVSFAAFSQPTHLVISQVYGGGGNSGAPFTHDYIEIFNPGTQPVALSGFSLQYSSATGTTWGVVPLSGTIGAKKYFLVQLAGGSNGSPLPAPDHTATINMSATSGKVALVQSIPSLLGSCPGNSVIVDFLGYGSANCSEVQASAVGSNILAVIRKAGGCQDHNNNSMDFILAAPSPKNSLSTDGECSQSSLPVYFSNEHAQIRNGLVEISWVNDSEYEVLSYSIEGSGNGNSFELIKELFPVKNDGNKASYKYSVQPQHHIGFYRIRGLEINGTITYSKIIQAVAINRSGLIYLYPNPVREELFIETDNRGEKEIHLTMYNSAGIELENLRMKSSEGRFKCRVRVNHLKPGIYFITSNGRPAWKFIKQ